MTCPGTNGSGTWALNQSCQARARRSAAARTAEVDPAPPVGPLGGRGGLRLEEVAERVVVAPLVVPAGIAPVLEADVAHGRLLPPALEPPVGPDPVPGVVELLVAPEAQVLDPGGPGRLVDGLGVDPLDEVDDGRLAAGVVAVAAAVHGLDPLEVGGVGERQDLAPLGRVEEDGRVTRPAGVGEGQDDLVERAEGLGQYQSARSSESGRS